MPRGTAATLRLGEAVRLGQATSQAVHFVMARWPHTRVVRQFWECPHCGALVGSKTARVRHRMREARIEIALLELGLLEPGLDIRITDDTSV